MQIFVIIFAFIALGNAQRLHRIPINKSKNFIKNLGNVRAERHYFMNRYNAQIVHNDTTDECVEDLDGIAMEFYGEISIGTPPQTLTALFDTGSPVFFVQKEMNSNGVQVTGFNTSASTTFYQTQLALLEIINYNSQLNEYVYVCEDNVNVAGMELFNPSFVVSSAYDYSFKYPVILGLGYNFNNLNTYAPPLDYMLQQGFIEKKIFSFYFNHNNYSSTNNASQIIFGGSDSSLYQGDLVYSNVLPATNWNIYLDKVSINGIQAAPKIQAAVDTSYSFIGAPIEAYVRINQQINGTVDDEGIYYVNCDVILELPDVVFNINGENFDLKASSYLSKVTGNNGEIMCMVAFIFMNTDHWVLGQAFVSAFYTEFDQDNNRIGFAYPISN